jgi:hypothetical protein
MSDITTVASEMAQRAGELLDDLDEDQRAKATLSFSDEEERRRWFYTPTQRPGVMLRELNPIQQQRVRRLLATGLSQPGYNHTSAVIGLEYLVDYWSGFPDRPWGDTPNSRVRDPGNYTVAVFGTPGDEAGWGWRIGGHHVSTQFTLRKDAIAPTPAFFGAEPARAPLPGGASLRPLAAEEDLARQLLLALRPGQREQAVIAPIAPTDIVQTNRPRVEEGALPPIGGTGPGGEGLRRQLGLTPEHDEMVRYSSTPKGIAAGDLDDAQRGLMTKLMRTYLEHFRDEIAAQYDSVFDDGSIAKTHFAWAGPDHDGAPHYYRLQSDRLLIEYDCTQNNANHTHSVWRDLQGDFGEDILRDHYALETHNA